MAYTSRTCSICTDPLDDFEQCCLTNCGHVFHYGCVKEWLKRKAECPLCRKIFANRHICRLYFSMEENRRLLHSSSSSNEEALAATINDQKARIISLGKRLAILEVKCDVSDKKNKDASAEIAARAREVEELVEEVEAKNQIIKLMQQESRNAHNFLSTEIESKNRELEAMTRKLEETERKIKRSSKEYDELKMQYNLQTIELNQLVLDLQKSRKSFGEKRSEELPDVGTPDFVRKSDPDRKPTWLIGQKQTKFPNANQISEPTTSSENTSATGIIIDF
ncbi:ring finger domain-containing protein [Ditylenchus destructor]|nr:ring finger domain-containing protein [Ditylenchus destructor]